MIVRWYGHDCFLFYSKKGSRILIDPFGTEIRYPFPPLTAEIVVISHEHPDHNAVWRVMGEPFIVKRINPGPCEYEIPLKLTQETFFFKGIPAFHDEDSGRKHGPNTVFTWEMDGYRICHLGDLGQPLSPEQTKAIGKTDLLFIPVGGGSVMSPDNALIVIETLDPKYVFPMHYKTPEVSGNFLPLENFLNRMKNVERAKSNQIEIDTVRNEQTTIVFEIRAKA